MQMKLKYKKNTVDFLIFTLFRFARFFLRLIPKIVLDKIVFGLSRFAYCVNVRHRRIIYKNLDYFLGVDKQQQKMIAKSVYLHFLHYVADMVKTEFRDKDQLAAMVKIENDAQIRQSIIDKEKIIMMSGHFGYWELIGQCLSAFYCPFVTIGQKLQNSKRLTDELNMYRKRSGMEVLKKRGAMRGISSALKHNKIVGFLTDQSTREGASVEFFGRELIYIESASRLAKKFNAVIYPTFITTRDFRSYTLFFLDPIRPDNTVDQDADIQRMVKEEAKSLETAVRRCPDEYFWFHKRMKHQIANFYD